MFALQSDHHLKSTIPLVLFMSDFLESILKLKVNHYSASVGVEAKHSKDSQPFKKGLSHLILNQHEPGSRFPSAEKVSQHPACKAPSGSYVSIGSPLSLLNSREDEPNVLNISSWVNPFITGINFVKDLHAAFKTNILFF